MVFNFCSLKNFIFVAQFLNDNEKNYIVPILSDFYNTFFQDGIKFGKQSFAKTLEQAKKENKLIFRCFLLHGVQNC